MASGTFPSFRVTLLIGATPARRTECVEAYRTQQKFHRKCNVSRLSVALWLGALLSDFYEEVHYETCR